MALLARKLSTYLVSVIICCIVLLSILVFNQEPWQKVLIKRGHANVIEQSDQILRLHKKDSNQSIGKTTLREDIVHEEGMSSHKVSSISVDQGPSKFHGKKPKLTNYHQATALDQPDDSVRDNPDDFWNMNYEERSKFQRRQVNKYCERYTQHIDEDQLPARQLLLHKEQKVAFCYVPKSACTTFKILLLHSQGMLPDQYLDYNKHKQPHIAPQLRKILLSALGSEERDAVIRDYFKIVMFRHPLERLLSGYRSKMSIAVRNKRKIIDENDRNIEGDLLLEDKKALIAHAYPNKYKKWKAAHESYPVNITFSDFINYWMNSERLSLNAHFSPVVRLCRPCLVRYDYYGNFKTFGNDSKLLMERIGASEEELRPQYPKPSDELVNKYYRQLSEDQKLKILKKLAPELRLYYMLFPPEKDTHKQMLGIDASID